jgi:hypothetical protein
MMKMQHEKGVDIAEKRRLETKEFYRLLTSLCARAFPHNARGYMGTDMDRSSLFSSVGWSPDFSPFYFTDDFLFY